MIEGDIPATAGTGRNRQNGYNLVDSSEAVSQPAFMTAMRAHSYIFAILEDVQDERRAAAASLVSVCGRTRKASRAASHSARTRAPS